jgi:hypothetical protein
MSEPVPFSLRVRLGQCEVEISGSRDEVMLTLKDLPNLVATISEAFAQSGVDIANIESPSPQPSVGSTPKSTEGVSSAYPSIQSTGNCSDAVLKLLSTDWGRSTPRTLPELVEAMRANAVHFPSTTLSGVLNWLVRKSRVKRWKTEKGYVYTLSGPNPVVRSMEQAQNDIGLGIASSGGG